MTPPPFSLLGWIIWSSLFSWRWNRVAALSLLLVSNLQQSPKLLSQRNVS
ncbi:hypothetical protein Lalb_Chr09g0325701 [Lupinus albus]|uniref:Uncharacterized protein n=1 Tax=Lupinus albus TaxID=3870 RepID=A0A6A4Q0I9_LUPAL|nr:hypothetical protein Lalb_Chr09g0325701 [Lupinus albus]